MQRPIFPKQRKTKKSLKKKRIKKVKINLAQYKKTLIESRKSLKDQLKEMERQLGSLPESQRGTEGEKLFLANKRLIWQLIQKVEDELHRLKAGETGLGRPR